MLILLRGVHLGNVILLHWVHLGYVILLRGVHLGNVNSSSWGASRKC